MKYSIIVDLLMLSGCHQATNINDIESAIQICEQNSAKVFEIYAYFDGTESVQCTNRIKYPLK